MLGRDLTYVESGFIEIGKNGKITKTGAGNYSNKVLNDKIGSNNQDDLTIFDWKGYVG